MNSRIKTYRQKNNLTQVQVAKRSFISERGYQDIEAQKKKPNVHTAMAIAKVLNTTVEELFGDDDQSQSK